MKSRQSIAYIFSIIILSIASIIYGCAVFESQPSEDSQLGSQGQSRRTAIFADGDILRQINAQNITSINGSVTIQVDELESPVAIGSTPVYFRDNAGAMEYSIDGAAWIDLQGIPYTNHSSFNIGYGITTGIIELQFASQDAFRYDEDAAALEFWDGTSWRDVGSDEAASTQDIYTQPGANVTSGLVDHNMRSLIPANEISENADEFTITLAAHSSEDIKINQVYIGYQAITGNIWDFDGNQLQVRFNNGTGFVHILEGETKESDIIYFPLDSTQDVILALDFRSGDSDYDGSRFTRYLDSAYVVYEKSGSGSNESSQTAPSGYTLWADAGRLMSLITITETENSGSSLLKIAGDIASTFPENTYPGVDDYVLAERSGDGVKYRMTFENVLRIPITITSIDAATYTWLTNDTHAHILYSGAMSLTIPSALIAEPGRRFNVKDALGDAGTNTITIRSEGSELFDNTSTLWITTDYDSVSFYSYSSLLFTY